LTRPFDQHLDSDELDGLVSLRTVGVSDSVQLSEQALREAQGHVESCQDCSRKVQMHKSVHSEILRIRVPNDVPPGPDCVADIEWLNVAAGLLPEAKTRELMKHAAQCGYCGPLLQSAAETLSDEATPNEKGALAGLSSSQPDWQADLAETLRSQIQDRRLASENISWRHGFFSWPRPVFAVAEVAALVVAGWVGSRVLSPPSAEQLLAQAYTEHRTLQLRIPGAKFAPTQVERGGSTSNQDRSPALLKAEALVDENLRKNPNDPVWLQAKARADLLEGNYESAIRSLERVLETQPESPNLLSDFALAYYERAVSTGLVSDLNKAMNFLEGALAKSPNDPTVLFNRAIVSERMLLYDQAVDDWNRYLRVDPTGPWADDARSRLAALKDKLKTRGRRHGSPLLRDTTTPAKQDGREPVATTCLPVERRVPPEG